MANLNHPLRSVPHEIKLNIFSRLPVESVLDCKLVCKSWRNLIRTHANSTYFAGLHHRYRYGHVPHGLVQQQKQHGPFYHYHYGSDSDTMSFVASGKWTQAFWYLEYKHGDKQPNYRIKMMRMNPPVGMPVGLVGSANGLICLSAKTKYNGIPTYRNRLAESPDEPICICNPITRECVILPGILMDERGGIDGVHIVSGFGYHPLTNDYKVVRIYYVGNPNCPSFKGKVEVYTLGNGRGWRSAGETNYFLRPGHFEDPRGVCLNGALHWIINYDNKFADILAFDLENEMFHLVHIPNRETYSRRRIFVIGQCLGLECSYGGSRELWFLKKNKDYYRSTSYHMNEQYYKSWSWNGAFTIPPELSIFSIFSIFSITKTGEILLMDGPGVVCYNPSLRKITSQNVLELNEKKVYCDLPISHINSFVSLEALGEKNVMKLVAESSPKMLLQVCLVGFLFIFGAPLVYLLPLWLRL